MFAEGLPGMGSGQDASPFLLFHSHQDPMSWAAGVYLRGWPVCESAQASGWRGLRLSCCSVAGGWARPQCQH